jgi:hypothetical protein
MDAAILKAISFGSTSGSLPAVKGPPEVDDRIAGEHAGIALAAILDRRDMLWDTDLQLVLESPRARRARLHSNHRRRTGRGRRLAARPPLGLHLRRIVSRYATWGLPVGVALELPQKRRR